ncbi:MAG: GNAT family N-acetyltransferase [Methanosarcina vacuolata]|jgi:GNAT superfamily N-acetyltransferase|nr:GNAT family N-acetyltransferase [Methanosarcina vacuolata]
MRKTSEKSENLKHANLDNELIILPLDEADDLSFFNCNSEELNDFLKTNALLDQNNLVNRTRLCFCNGSLAGFYSLAADTIETKNVIDGIESYPYRKYPAVKIARLAVDSRFERCGIGTFLMKIILAQVVSICDNIGCRYLLVDSKIESTGFYEKFEFKVAEKNKKTDFVPMYLNMQPYVRKEN